MTKIPTPVELKPEKKPEKKPLEHDANRTPQELRANVCGAETTTRTGTCRCGLIAQHARRMHRATIPGLYCWPVAEEGEDD